jgi:hypothetical protein
MQELAGTLGVEIDTVTHDMIVENARTRSKFSDGSELLEFLRQAPGVRLSNLIGAHREVAAVINTRSGTTLDREQLRSAFPDHQTFNVDAWAFESTARVMTDDETAIKRLAAAMVYYNLATACVLAGPSLQVVVLA